MLGQKNDLLVRALAALPEELDLIARTHMAAHSSSGRTNILFWPLQARETQLVHSHASRLTVIYKK